MLKSEARKIYRNRRDALTPSQRLKLDDLLLIQFQKLPLPHIATVLSFFPIEKKKEINTFVITDFLQFTNPGLQIAYPKTDMRLCNMQALVVDNNSKFEENEYSIPEPVGNDMIDAALLDLVLVPMLAFDKMGHRVGYGKGFYDRFLKKCRKDCIKAGLCYFDAIDQLDDAIEHDVPLDYCITPQMVYVF